MKVKKRLDVLLTEQGYADTRSKAQAIIMSGQVYVNGQKADKPGVSYEETVELEVRGAVCPYVSRGGLKLEKALRDLRDLLSLNSENKIYHYLYGITLWEMEFSRVARRDAVDHIKRAKSLGSVEAEKFLDDNKAEINRL